jgi:hypothetical protein
MSLSVATRMIDEVKSYCSSTTCCAQGKNSATIEQLERGGIPQKRPRRLKEVVSSSISGRFWQNRTEPTPLNPMESP